MALTEAQRTTLAAHIRASSDPDVVSALAVRNDTELARLYNLDSTFYIWRTSITPTEYREEMVWTEVDQLNAGSARIWDWITASMTMSINASRDNVRQGIADAFAANTTTRGNLLDIAKRFARLAESLFATGTGSEAVPGTLVYEGLVTVNDISRSLNENP